MLPRHALKVLGLTEAASEDDIRGAWRKKARLFHPDSPFADINAFHHAKAAYDILRPQAEQSLKRRVRVPARSSRAS
jgi:DnaJ-class molecular chaperone